MTVAILDKAAIVYPNYYGSAAAQSMSSLVSSIAILAVCAPFASMLSAKLGKKELSTISCLSGAGIYIVCMILKPQNAYVYVLFFTLAYMGVGFFNTVIWAMITDVIDDAEIKNGIREDGTIYAVYSFARKVGQALSSGMVGGLLSLIGYTEATAFDPNVTEGIFYLSCIVPILGFILVALALIFIYPLSKKRVEDNCTKLAQRRGNPA